MKNIKPISINGNINVSALLSDGKKIKLSKLSGKVIMDAMISGNIVFQNGKEMFACSTDSEIKDSETYSVIISNHDVEVIRHASEKTTKITYEDIMKEGNRVLSELFGDELLRNLFK